MPVHVCTRFTCDDYSLIKGAVFDGKPIKPVNRLYLNPKDLQSGWGLVVAIGPNGRTQFYNPIRRRWTRTWWWFTLVPPRRMKLNPMKRPWERPDPPLRRSSPPPA